MAEIIESPVKEAPGRRPSDSSDTEYDPQFKPIVQLPEVEIVTNEENETVLLKMRAKLYRFDTNCDPHEWKERGTGEMKMLQNTENHSVRIVMRRDKTHKVCANHFITPWLKLTPCLGSEKAFVYTVPADFADEEIKTECLAIKFANVDNASIFKNQFEEAKKSVATKCHLYNGEGDENTDSSSDDEDENDVKDDKEKSLVLEKLSDLSVKETEEKSPSK